MTIDSGSSPSVTEALTVLEGLKKAIKEHPGAPFLDPYRSAIKVIRDNDPAEWVRLRRLLKNAGIGVRELNKHLPNDERDRDEHAGTSVEPVRAGDMLAEIPTPDLLIPPPYYLTKESTVKTMMNRDAGQYESTIAHAPVVIIGRLKDSDENTEFLRLAWWRGGWQEITVDRGRLMSARKIVELASQGFPVADTTAKELVTYLNTLEALNYDRIPCARVSSHLGWQGKHGEQGFLWGPTLLLPDGESRLETNLDDLPPGEWPRDGVAFRGIGSGDSQIASGFFEEGAFDEWLLIVSRIKNHPKVLFALYVALVAPYLEIVDAPNFVIDWAQPTTTGKTTTLRLGASVWGNPDERSARTLIHPWNVTHVWVERACAMLSGLPLILDDTKTARRPDQISETIYIAVNGQGRGRGNIKSLAASKSWHINVLSSGESPATSYSQDGGSRTRCLEVRGVPFGTVTQTTRKLIAELNAGVIRNFGHAGPRFVQGLLKQRERWGQLRVTYRHAVDQFPKLSNDPVGGRLAGYGAAIECVALLAHDILKLPWAYDDTVRKLWPGIVAEASDAAGDHRALLDAMAAAHSCEEAFHGREAHMGREHDTRIPPGGWLGRWDPSENWKSIAFLPTKLKEILKAEGYEPEAILGSWFERGWLDCDKGRRTKSVRAGSGPTHMVVIKRSAIDDAERGQWGRIGDGSGDVQEKDTK